MRILLLTQWFQPEPLFKGLPFARELQRRGHSVEVLTGFPNYPGGRLYPGYRVRFYQRETIEGISVIRVPLYPSHDGSALKRVANYLSFALSASLLGAALVRRADVMYVYHPPATVGLPAIVISMLRRIPFVVDIQDLWPDTLESTGMVRNAFILSLVGLWCRVVYALAARITVLSRGFQEALVERSVPRDKVVVIYNWCDESQVIAESPSQSLANSLGLAGKFVIVFAGNMGRAQQLDTVLDAAASLAAREPNVRFVFVGSGIESERLKRRVSSEHIGNVLFVPRQSVTDVGRYLALGDALLVNLSNDALFRITIPSKTQAYLACGKPLLMAVSGEAAELVEGAGAGIACEPGNPQALAEAVSTLRRMSRSERDAMGERAIAFYWSKLALSIGTERFEQVFREVAQC